MSGHSKWSGIKHKKAIVDAQRGKLFSRITKEIMAAARLGGGNPDTNPRLRLAITKGREGNLPKDKVENAIKKGTGELPGVTYEEMVVECYGPGGVALYIESLTDNKNRTTAELRSLLSRNQGSIAGAGSVSWLFETKGVIILDSGLVSEDAVMEAALDAGVEDITTEGDQITVTTTPQNYEPVKEAIKKASISWQSADLSRIPSNTVTVSDPASAKALLKLIELIEDHDDTQRVSANFDIPDDILRDYEAGS